MTNWSEIADDIGYEIAKHVPLEVEVFARLGCVSKLWRSFAVYYKTSHIPCAPYLMLAKRENDKKDDSGDGVRTMYSVYNQRVFNLSLPQAQGRRCWGTPYGWLLTMGIDLNINLLNPLSQVQIPLPPQPALPKQHSEYVPPKRLCRGFIEKMVLASNPSLWCSSTQTATCGHDHCPVVMAIYGSTHYLAFARPGGKGWASLEGPASYNAQDTIFFNGHFFVVTHRGMLRICEIDTTPPTATEFAYPPDGFNPVNAVYLVEMSGNLHLLVRENTSIDDREYEYESEAPEDVDDHGADDAGEDEGEAEDVGEDRDEAEDVVEVKDEANDAGQDQDGDNEDENEDEEVVTGFHYQTKHFFVYKLDFSTKKWIKVNDLGDHAFFVGNNLSFSISTSNYPGFKRNCIYFTDDHMETYENGFCDVGVYDVGKDTVEDIFSSGDELSMISRPVFFMPTLS